MLTVLKFCVDRKEPCTGETPVVEQFESLRKNRTITTKVLLILHTVNTTPEKSLGKQIL